MDKSSSSYSGLVNLPLAVVSVYKRLPLNDIRLLSSRCQLEVIPLHLVKKSIYRRLSLFR